MSKFRRTAVAAIALALLAVSAFAGAASAHVAAKDVAVSVIDNAFEPKTITINAGDTIVWTNNGARNHTVTASDGSWDSGRLAPGQTFSRKFDNPGTIAYYCIPHGTPTGQGMAGTIVVQAAATAPAPSAPAPAAQAPAVAGAQPQAATPSVEVSDQPVSGGSVTVAKVVAAQGGWMVIHTNTADNKPGPVIGQTQVNAGENSNVMVMLSQTPKDGDRLWAMLHIDAPQPGVYEFPGADVPVNQGGQIVMKQFTVTGGQVAGAQPSALPRTGDGSDSGLWLVAGALALVLAGSGLAARLAASRRAR